FRQYDYFSQRAGGVGQSQLARFPHRRMVREPSRKSAIGREGKPPQRHWRNLPYAALFDWSRPVVAGNPALAEEPERELEIEFCAHQLGLAQCAWILDLRLSRDVGSLGNLLFLPAGVQRHG